MHDYAICMLHSITLLQSSEKKNSFGSLTHKCIHSFWFFLQYFLGKDRQICRTTHELRRAELAVGTDLSAALQFDDSRRRQVELRWALQICREICLVQGWQKGSVMGCGVLHGCGLGIVVGQCGTVLARWTDIAVTLDPMFETAYIVLSTNKNIKTRYGTADLCSLCVLT